MESYNLLFEILGYLAPAALVVSFFFKNMKVLRWVNTVGCVLFVAYGVYFGAWPVVVANVIISLTNVYYLIFTKEIKYVHDITATDSQKDFMREAIRLAQQNVETSNGGPFGAVIVKDGEQIATGVNLVTSTNDPTSHAEINAIRSACRRLQTFDLRGCEIYSSCEPGALSMSAIYWAHIDKVYYAASRTEAAAAGFDEAPLYDDMGRPLNQRKLPVVPLLHTEGAAPLKLWQNAKIKVNY